MLDLKALREQRAEIVGKMQTIIEAAEKDDRDLTAEEQTSFDALQAQEKGLASRIDRIVALNASTAELAAVQPAAGRRNGPSGDLGGRGPEAKKEFESFGEFMAAVRFNPSDQRLNYVEGISRTEAVIEEGGEIRAEFRMDNDAQGGFMIPPQLRETIMRIDPQASLVRPRANVIPPGSPPDSGVIIPALDQSGAAPSNMFGGVQVVWIGEGDDKPETDGKVRQIELEPHEVAGFTTVTDKFLRNWQAAGPFIENLLRGAVTAAEDYAFLRGTGVHQPLGAINAGATYYINRLTAGHIKYVDLVAMVARLLMRDGVSPVWSMPQAAMPELATMTDPLGQYIWKPEGADVKNGFAGTLLGYPVRWNNRSPGLGSKGDVLIADWSYYLIKDGSGPFVATSEHVKFLQNKTVVKIFWNVDGSPWLTAPIQEENGYQVSPFVGLDVPA